MAIGVNFKQPFAGEPALVESVSVAIYIRSVATPLKSSIDKDEDLQV